MSPFNLLLPPGSIAIGELLQDYSQCPRRLSQDILQIKLPKGQTIDVGWWPRFDPNGKFQIVVFDGDWEEDNLQEPIELSNPYAVASKIREIVLRLSPRQSVDHSTEKAFPPHQFNNPTSYKLEMVTA